MQSPRFIRIVYLARLREAFGSAGEALELPAESSTVAALRKHLAGRGGAWASELAAGRALRVAVNHEIAGPDTPIAPGDEVAFFPPVTGG
jgi:molybdopterin synthase sulfur carrier subunit